MPINVAGHTPLMFLTTVDDANAVLAYALNGAATLLLAALLWGVRLLMKKAVQVYEKVEHLDQCMDDTQSTINKHLVQADERDAKIARLQQELSEERAQRLALEAYMRGLNRLAIDAPLTAIPVDGGA